MHASDSLCISHVSRSSETLLTQQYAAAAVESLVADHHDNQLLVCRAGAITPLVELLGSDSRQTQDHAVSCMHLRPYVSPHVSPRSDSRQTQEHAVSALLHLASSVGESRDDLVRHLPSSPYVHAGDDLVRQLVGVIRQRNAAAQMKAAEALAVLAGRSDENRKAITAAAAVEPLVRLLGDGRGVRSATPQERAAAVLADLARSGENKV